MRILPLALVLLLMACAVPTATQAQVPTVDYAIRPSGGTTSMNVDLQSAAVNVRFTLDTSEYAHANVEGIVVRLTQGANQTQVQLQSPAAQGVSGTVWRGVFSTTHRDLTRGIHAVTALVAAGGSTTPVDSVSRTITATATETAKPVLNASLAGPTRTVRLGPGDDLSVLVDDPSPSAGIREVTYRIVGLTPTLPLEFPYIVRGTSLREGSQTVVVNATDRAFNRATQTFTVIMDTQAPDLQVDVPANVFVGVANKVVVRVNDTNAYNLTFTVGNKTVSVPGSGALQAHEHLLQPTAAGAGALTVRARDILGNSVERSYTYTARILETDLEVVKVSVVPERPLAGEAMTLKVQARQDPGHAPLDVNVTLSGPLVGTHRMSLPASGHANFTLTKPIPVGRHRVTATLQAPAGVVELDGANQEGFADIEVFFAKVDADNKTYYIRANDLGLPSHAITTTGGSFPLRVVEDGSSIAYQFTADGKVVEWDPVADPPANSTTTPTGSKAKGSPSLAPLVGALAFVAVAIALRRRR